MVVSNMKESCGKEIGEMADGKTRLSHRRLAALILVILTIVPLSLTAVGSANGNHHLIVSTSIYRHSASNASTPTVWTYETPEGLFPAGGSPVVAELSGNGQKEVLVFMQNSTAMLDIATQGEQLILYCLNGTTGTAIWNYTILGGNPTVADLFGNGRLEVLVGSGGFNPLDPQYTKVRAGVTCLNGTSGSKIWDYNTTYDDCFSSPVVADLNGDGKKEVIAVSYDGTYCLNGMTGDKLWSYPTGCGYSSPVVADLFGNGKMEVLVAAFWNSLYCLDGTTGNMLWFSTTGYNDYSPTLADLFGDGKLEVLVGSRDGGVYCFDGKTGDKLWNFTAEIGDSHLSYRNDITSSPLAADLFGDGKEEVLVGSMDYSAYYLNGATGNTIWKYKTGDQVPCSPVAADLLGDGKKEVLVGSQDGNVYCLDGMTGDKLWNCTTGAVYTSPVVVYGPEGGTLALVGADSLVAGLYFINGGTGELVLMYPTGGTLTSPPVVADVLGNGEKEVLVGVEIASTFGTAGRSLTSSPSACGAIYCISLPEVPPRSPSGKLGNDFLITLVILGIGGAGAAAVIVALVKVKINKKGL
jgi:outer membrane protein assembly factor BamB